MTEENLRERIVGDGPTTAKMAVGSLIHTALEQRVTQGAHEISGRLFEFAVTDSEEPFGLARCLSSSPRIELREAKVRHIVEDILLSCRVDLVWPACIVDYKTSRKRPYWTDLASSVQWRVYCLTLGIPYFVFRHYQYAITDEDGKRWGRWSKGRQVFHVGRPEDYECRIDCDMETVVDLCRDLILTAEGLDCAGALREDRYDALKGLSSVGRGADDSPGLTALEADTVRACHAAIEALRGNEYNPDTLVSTIRTVREWAEACDTAARNGPCTYRTADWYSRAATTAFCALHDMEDLL